MITSIEIAALAAALAAAQGQFDAIVRERTAKIESSKASYGYKYADLGAVLDAVRGPLSANGIAIAAAPTIEIVSEKGDDGKTVVYAKVAVETRLLHSSGQWIANVVRGESADTRPQSIGSAITYLRRYGLMALLGVASEDDDGAASSSAAPKAKSSRTPPPASAQDARPAATPATRTAPADSTDSTQETPRAAPAPEAGAASGHTWTDGERKAFFRELDRLGYGSGWDDLKAWCASKKWPHPGDLTQERRIRFLDYIGSEKGSEEFVTWSAERPAESAA